MHAYYTRNPKRKEKLYNRSLACFYSILRFFIYLLFPFSFSFYKPQRGTACRAEILDRSLQNRLFLPICIYTNIGLGRSVHLDTSGLSKSEQPKARLFRNMGKWEKVYKRGILAATGQRIVFSSQEQSRRVSKQSRFVV